MSSANSTPAGSIRLQLTNGVTGDVSTYTLRANVDFPVLVTRLITRLFGNRAAHSRRHDHFSEVDGRHEWDGIVEGRNLTIIEIR
jgi:hypothetical protein